MARRPDFNTFFGLAVAAAGIAGGLVLEKGQPHDFLQAASALIVLGGTAGALLLSTPPASFLSALRRLPSLFYEEICDRRVVIEQIVAFATHARRRGIVALDEQARRLEFPFLKKAVLLAVDGVDTKELRRQLELEIQIDDDRADADARVFETAAGYAPTVGILGAVFGLIQVMKRLDDIGDVGHGIAVAFVATIYGIGVANLLLFPAAAKIRARAARLARDREMILEGVVALAGGLHPYLVRSRLENFLESRHRPAEAEEEEEAAAPSARVSPARSRA
jgi:chemotaxis protein MotA